MEDERKPQDEPQDEVKDEVKKSGVRSKELSEEELDKAAGGVESVSNIMKTKHDTVKNSISNVR